MTGRDLIVYILKQHLEDEEVFKDGKLLDFINEEEAAAKFEVGLPTLRVWIAMKWINGFTIGDSIFFPKDIADPREVLESEAENGEQ